MWHDERLLIDGEMVAAEGGRTFETINPATGEVLGTAADASVGDAKRAIEAARRAFDSTTWATDHAFRAHCLRQLHEALVRHTEELREVIVADVGAPLTLTHGPQLETPIGIVRWYTELLEKFEWTEDLGTAEAYGVDPPPLGRRRNRSASSPRSCRTTIPLQITLAKLVPALAAGCTVVVKGPPDTPWATQTFARILAEETDIPAGVVSVITSSSVDVGGGAHHRSDDRHGELHRVHRNGAADHGGGERHREEGVPRARRQVGVHRARRRRPGASPA